MTIIPLQTYAAFALASFILLLIPGPTIIMVITQALGHGRRIAVASVLGVGLGDLIAATLSTIGVGTILAASAMLFTAVKWAGAAYLVYIGVKMWRSPVSDLAHELEKAQTNKSRAGVFRDAFLVTVFNPKSIVFFMAFMPQFISRAHAFAPQAAVLIVTFVVLGIVNAYGYALLASSARRVIRRPKVLRVATRTGASFLIAAGLASLFARRVAA